MVESYLNYLSSTLAPASSSFFLSSSASALDAPSLTVCGAPSTRSLASFRPRPVTSRTTLITATFLSPPLVITTLKSSFSSAAAASPPAAGAAASAAADTPNFSSIAEISSTISITDFSAIASRICSLVSGIAIVPMK
ncbi:50S ribosomal protein L7/L12 [Moraxella bovoculi 237]|uniref:50S ribosomal protein L7/L12 n=1 Tax=Moraxella bovoculi 237 TaxID=743974 RepID=A0A066UD91_9GAMM|nr:50S ribosomal protein L7/L12 [Moraxella bovoculi 237]